MSTPDDTWRKEKPGQFRVWAHPFQGSLHPIESNPFDHIEDARRCAWAEQLYMGRISTFYVAQCTERPGEFRKVEEINLSKVLELAMLLLHEAPIERFR